MGVFPIVKLLNHAKYQVKEAGEVPMDGSKSISIIELIQ